MKKTTKRGKVSKNYNAVMSTYKKNEDNNLHSENVVLLAKNVGTASDLTKAKAILAEHNKLGYISTDLLKKRDALSKKLYAKLVKLTTPKKEDGGVVDNPKTIPNDPKQPNMFSQDSGIVDDTAEATGEKFAKGGSLTNTIYIFEFEQYGENKRADVRTERGEMSAKNMIKLNYGIPTNKIKLVRKVESSGYFPEGIYNYQKYAEGGGVGDKNVFIQTTDFIADFSLIGKTVTITNEEDEHGKYGEEGKVVSIIEPTNSQLKRGYKLVSYVVDFNGQELTYLRSEFYVGKKKYAKGGSVNVSVETPGTIEPAGKTETGVIKGEISGIPDMQPLEENVYAKGGSVESDSPKIYVASLEHYNNGKLVGKWFDFADYSDEGELAEAIQEYLDELGVEEYAVHDYENFPSSYYHEYMGKGDFAKIYAVYAPAEERGIPFNVLAEAASDLGYKDEPEKVAEDMYHGAYKDWKDFAYEVQEMGVNNPEYYFDYEALGSDERINASEEDEKEWGWDEMTDEEIGEQIVENYGGFSELPKKLTEMYFDYDKLVNDLEYEYISVRGDDGLEYFFYRNYAKGGKIGGTSFGSAGNILPWLGI